MRRPGRIILRALLAALLLVAIFAAFWLGLIPQRLSPLAPISLGEAPSWFVDFRLAALRRDPELCRAVLREPHIKATPIPVGRSRTLTEPDAWWHATSSLPSTTALATAQIKRDVDPGSSCR